MSIVNPDLTGSYFTLYNPEGTDIFTAENLSFAVQTNFTQSPKRDYSNALSEPSKLFTLENLSDLSFEESKLLTNNSIQVFLNVDKTNLLSYAYFNSLFEKFNFSIRNIIQKWPGSLYVEGNVNGIPKSSVQFYSYDPQTNITTFSVPVDTIRNKFEINFLSNTIGESLSNLTTNYSKYNLLYDGTEYELTAFTGSPKSNSGFITLQVEGQPFESFSGTKFRASFHIKPNSTQINKFFSELDELESYLLSRDTSPLYKSKFVDRQTLSNGAVVNVPLTFIWPVTDGYNIDVDTDEFKIYLQDLNNLAAKYDKERTDILRRFLVPQVIFDFDTEDGRIYKLYSSYAYNFDSVKKFIDGITSANKVTYDKRENISDNLIKNIAKNLGWGIINTNSDNDLIQSLIGDSDGTIPNHIDQEFWRRVVINTSWVVQSKGTRKAVDFLFRLIGAPECLLEFQEHIYVSQNKLNTQTSADLYNQSPEPDSLAFNPSGYPQYVENNPEYWFQGDGGWYEVNDNITPNKEPLGVHIGDYDKGQRYFDLFREAGFNLIREIDNKKSWSSIPTTGGTRLDNDYDTEYFANDERLVLNSKEVSLSIDIAKAIECDVYNCNVSTEYPINTSGASYNFLPQTNLTKFDTSNLPFIKYIEKAFRYFIDTKNRKVIDDAHGGGYPTLKYLYEKYLENSDCSSLTYESVASYVELLDSYWLDFVAQAIPATTIFIGNGEKWRNTIFHPQKYVYKRGINDGSEFQTTVKIEDDLPTIETQIIKTQGSVINTVKGALGTLKVVLEDIDFQYPCLGGSDTFFQRTSVNDTLQNIFIGGWDASYTSVEGKECEDGLCDTYYVECTYVEDGYFECDCDYSPSDPCLMDYIDCDYIDPDYIE